MLLEESPYSGSFWKLKLVGAWTIETSSRRKWAAYLVYKTIMAVVGTLALGSLLTDLVQVFGDFRKMTWNISITSLYVEGLVKNTFSFAQNKVLNAVRAELHKDGLRLNSQEHEIMNKQAEKQFKGLLKLYYGILFCFAPAWLSIRYFSYLWGPRQLPIPMRFPIDIDYYVAFVVSACVAFGGLFFIIETELAMFTLLIQISRENKKLLNDIPELNKLYDDEGCEKEINPWLKRIKTKALLRDFFMRQQKQRRYIEIFELVYSPSLLLEIIALSMLVIGSAILCILEAGSISWNLTYQVTYACAIVFDMFLICLIATDIRQECVSVADKVYSTHWYRMPVDIQRDIRMMIMRAQRPPKITCGKMMDLNLHAFMTILKNIYSWLALFNQLVVKVQ